MWSSGLGDKGTLLENPDLLLAYLLIALLLIDPLKLCHLAVICNDG